MTKDQLQRLQHSLGLDEFGQGRSHRNHFCGEDPVCRELVALGLMRESSRHPSPISGGSPVFHVTDAGKAAVRAQSPTRPKLSRSQQRYQIYREISDACDISFGEFLRLKLYEEAQA